MEKKEEIETKFKFSLGDENKVFGLYFVYQLLKSCSEIFKVCSIDNKIIIIILNTSVS